MPSSVVLCINAVGNENVPSSKSPWRMPSWQDPKDPPTCIVLCSKLLLNNAAGSCNCGMSMDCHRLELKNWIASEGSTKTCNAVANSRALLWTKSKKPCRHCLPTKPFRATCHRPDHTAWSSDPLKTCLDEEWHQANTYLMPKPGKPLRSAADLRPIALLSPFAKILARTAAKRLRPYVQAAVKHLTLFAYIEGRQAGDALDRVPM